MNEMRSRLLATAAAFMVVFGLAACAGETHESSEGSAEPGMAAEAGEHSGGGAVQEGAREGGEGEGEHGEAREDREGGEGEHGEAREGGEGGEGEHDEAREGREGGGGEHGEAREGGEHGGEGEHQEGEEGEEPGIYIDRAETWDMTRRGARLVLSFDVSQNAFVGTVENTTEQTLCAVRVEVHLAGGPELGPTPRTDVPPGGTAPVRLLTGGESFETWTAHPELSRCSG